MLGEMLLFILSKITFFTGAVVSGNGFPKPLSADEELDCLIKMQQGDKGAREKLITHNMRLVCHIVKKYSGVMETDDLISVGSIGLIKAVNTYQMGKGTQLATFAARCIENEILMLIRANKKYKGDISLSDPVGTDKDGNELTLMDLLCEPGDAVFESVDKEIERERFLKFIKGVLSDREYTVLCLRYGLKGDRNYAQREVAKFLKISRSYISRIEKKAIEKLRVEFKNQQNNC